MNTLFIFGAKYFVILSVVIAGIVLYLLPRPSQKKMLLLTIVSGVLAYATALIAGHFFQNPRPFVVGHFVPLISHAVDNGFPSDHALLTALLASVVFPFNRKASAALWLIAIFVSVSRVAVGVHHPIDVIGSFVIAIVMTVCGNWIVNRMLAKKSQAT